MSTELTKEQLQWNKVWDKWSNGELETPYKEILDYSSGINGGGHLCFFDNVVSSGNFEVLNETIKTLVAVLPEAFIKPLLKVYNSYVKDNAKEEDYVSSKTDRLANKADDVFYNNEESINELIRDYSKTIVL